jgi:hypothetical protein
MTMTTGGVTAEMGDDIGFVARAAAVKRHLHTLGRVVSYVFRQSLLGQRWFPSEREQSLHRVEIEQCTRKTLVLHDERGYELNRESPELRNLLMAITDLAGWLSSNRSTVAEIGVRNSSDMHMESPDFFAQFLDPFHRSRPAHSKGRSQMVRDRKLLASGRDLVATCIFVAMPGLRVPGQQGNAALALSALHQAVSPLNVYVLSSLTGLVIVSLDLEPVPVDAILSTLSAAEEIPMELRVGVTHGQIEIVEDVDGEMNAVGPVINTSARLAFARENDGALVHEDYVAMFGDALPAWLKEGARSEVTVAGKAHDALMRAFRAPYRFATAAQSRTAGTFVSKPAMMIAYDLSGFSKGDRAQLAKRFRAVSALFTKLKNVPPLGSAEWHLCPGGDGGILVLTGHEMTAMSHIPERLREFGEMGSLNMGPDLSVSMRVGVHYGLVSFYETADGVRRPTGTPVFVADVIAGDKVARAIEGVIVTRPIVDAMTSGSAARREEAWQALPPSEEPILANVERYFRSK